MKNCIIKPCKLLSLGLLLLTSTACTATKTPTAQVSSPEVALEAHRLEPASAPAVQPAVATAPKPVVALKPAAVEKPAISKAVNPQVAAAQVTPKIEETQPVETSASVGLAGEGLRLFVGDGSQTRALDFGSEMAIAVDILTNVWGEPFFASAVLCEPRNQLFDIVQWPNGMMVGGIAGEFVGWRAQDNAKATTMYGLGIGTPIAELRDAAVAINFFEDNIGKGFYVGEGNGIEGRLSASADDVVVEYLQAGDHCVYH